MEAKQAFRQTLIWSGAVLLSHVAAVAMKKVEHLARLPMKLARRRFLSLAALAIGCPAVSRVAAALDYPTRPVRMFVGFAAGGAPDIAARLVGQWLSERLGQQFVIENRSGAGGNIATEAVVD